VITIPRMLSRKPVLTISEICRRREPKTIALGGVAAGNIKANEHDRVPGIISNSGLTLIAVAKAARRGKIISVVAVLEVNSVKKVTMTHIAITIKIG